MVVWNCCWSLTFPEFTTTPSIELYFGGQAKISLTISAQTIKPMPSNKPRQPEMIRIFLTFGFNFSINNIIYFSFFVRRASLVYWHVAAQSRMYGAQGTPPHPYWPTPPIAHPSVEYAPAKPYAALLAHHM